MQVDVIDRLADEIGELAARLDAGTQRLLACVRQFDEAGGWERQGAISCAHWLAWRIGLGTGAARERVRVARALGTLPKIDESFGRGQLSYAKVRALTRVATPETEERLLELARHATGSAIAAAASPAPTRASCTATTSSTGCTAAPPASPRNTPLPFSPPRADVEDAVLTLREWARDRDIEIGPDTSLPWWDGSAVPDYDLAISSLLH